MQCISSSYDKAVVMDSLIILLLVIVIMLLTYSSIAFALALSRVEKTNSILEKNANILQNRIKKLELELTEYKLSVSESYEKCIFNEKFDL